VRTLRYQLLHSAAAALIEAKAQKGDYAVFLVHEFHGSRLNPEKVKPNKKDWTAFVNAFPALKGATIKRNQILGPISVPGGGRIDSSIPFYLGNLVSELQPSA
jgi:hypothetical protein